MNTILTPLKNLFAVAVLVFLMFASVNTYAQTTFGDDVDDEVFDDPDDPDNPGGGEVPTDPIDGGIYAGVLAAGIIGYTVTMRRKTAA
jgi:hypothetical protein